MIQLKSISKAFGGELILDDVSFTLGKMERTALVGRNGTGKSTLFRLIADFETPDAGEIIIPKNYRIGYLTQHIHFRETSIIDEAVLGLPHDEKDDVYKAEAILCGLGFTMESLLKNPQELSGGYHLRLHLAKLLLSNPDCLLLDEPTNYLDILSIRWLSQFLRAWPKELMVISHERDFLDHVCTHTMALHRKGIKKVAGPTAKIYTQIAQDELVHEKTRIGVEKKRDHLQAFIDRFGAKNTKAKAAQSRKKQIDRLPELQALCKLEDLSFSFPAKATNSEIILKAKSISFSYSDSPLITDFSLELENDARIAIIGKNGKGKSTLLKLIAEELQPSSGAIQSISGLTVGYFGQTHMSKLDPNLTVEEEIKRTHPDLTMEQARSIAGKMMFTQARSEKKIGVLSGGEKSRVVLGKLIASPCHLLLLDEPTNHLDIESMEAFMEALEEFEGAIVFVTHSEEMLKRLATQLIVFQNSSISHFNGGYDEFLEKGGFTEEAKPVVKKVSSYKEEKKRAHDLVIERSRALKPLQTKAQLVEGQIIALETETAHLQEELLKQFDASLAKALKAKQDEIETLFAELEALHSKMESLKATFEV